MESTFGLKSKREVRELDVYVATLAGAERAGLVRAKGTTSSSFDGGDGSIEAASASVAQLLSALEDAIARPVIDETGLQGSFDVRFRWDPAAGPDAIVREAAKQLGILLRRQGGGSRSRLSKPPKRDRNGCRNPAAAA